MMGPEIASGPGQRAAWVRQFSAIASIVVRAVQPSVLGDEGQCRSYRVALIVQLVPRGDLTVIPADGWGPNPNFRWITLCPGNGPGMHIASLATGPCAGHQHIPVAAPCGPFIALQRYFGQSVRSRDACIVSRCHPHRR